MKSLIIFSLFFGLNAFAGSSTCIDVTNVTTGNTYTASDTDCIIRVNRPFSETDFQIFLPESGDTFTIQNGADPASDHCENYGTELDPYWFCNPRALTVFSVDAINNTVDGQQSVTDAGYYLQGDVHRNSYTFTYNSGTSNWDATYGTWY